MDNLALHSIPHRSNTISFPYTKQENWKSTLDFDDCFEKCKTLFLTAAYENTNEITSNTVVIQVDKHMQIVLQNFPFIFQNVTDP